MFHQIQTLINGMPWWKPALVAEVVYLSMMVLMYPFNPFKWYKTHYLSLYTWPATVTLYFGYADWFLRHSFWQYELILSELIAIVVVVPLWILFIYINRDWPLYHMRLLWQLPKPTSEEQLQKRDKLVETGNVRNIFKVVEGGKND